MALEDDLCFHSFPVFSLVLGSAPLVSMTRLIDGGIQLLCESSGWFPQPTVKWKDPQGHDLPSDSKANADRHGLFDVEASLIVQENAGIVSCSIQYLDQSREVESRVWIRGEWGGGRGACCVAQKETMSLSLRVAV